MTSPSYTLETIYAGALDQIKELRDTGKLSSADYDMITGDSTPGDVLTFMNDTILRHARSQSDKQTRVREKAKPLLEGLERFGGVIDIFASSSPQVHGVNPARLIWGFMKFLLLVARDIVDTFDTVLTLLEDVIKELPALQAYINIYGSSKLQLLREPLVDIYAAFIVLGLQALKLFGRSAHRTIGRSAWRSLDSDFKSLISRIEKNRTIVERNAAVERSNQADEASKVQLLENHRAETFREEVRLFSANTAGKDSLQTLSTPLSLIDAPLDLLSVHSIDREAELARLDTIFTAGDPRVPRRCAIYGMPGLGKTQLALRYAKLVSDRQRFPLVFWISAATTEKLNQGFTNVLHLVGHVERNHPEQSARLTAARRWLEEYKTADSKGWLLIFDNVNKNTASFLRDHLPRSGYDGCILFTTRTDDTAKVLASSAGEVHHTFELQAPGSEDAACILLGYVGLDAGTIHSDDLNKATELVNSIGRLPLAVDQVASFMKQSHKTIDNILELYRSDQKVEIIKWENDLSSYEQKSVAATFNLQFNELSRRSPDTSNLLKILSFLDPESICVDVVTGGIEELRKASRPQLQPTLGFRDKLKKTLGGHRVVQRSHHEAPPLLSSQLSPKVDSLATLLQSPMRYQEAIQHLQNLSLLQRQTNGTTSALRLHDLVQYLAQENTRIEGAQQQWFQCAVALVCGGFQNIGDCSLPQSWSQYEMFVPHVQALIKHADLHRIENDLVLGASMLVSYYWGARGRYREAESVCQWALAGYVKQLRPRHLKTSRAKSLVARFYGSQGMHKEAEAPCNQVLLEMEQSLGPTHPTILVAMQSTANTDLLSGSYEEAKANCSQALEELQKGLKLEHQGILLVLEQLAHLHQAQGRSRKAEALYKQILEIDKGQLGFKHDTLYTMFLIATTYRDQGQYTEAEVLYKQVLECQERQLGSEHPHTLWTMSSLASAYSQQGQYIEAEVLYKHALEVQERQLGSEHCDTFRTMSNLANAYHDQGQYIEAEVLYKQALEGQERQLGSEHPDTHWTMSRLATAYRLQGQYIEAEVLYKQVLECQERQLGSEHPNTLCTMSWLANTYHDQGQYIEAEVLYKQALEGQERQLGSEHPDTHWTMSGLATAYRLQGQYIEAELLYKQVLECQERQLGSEHPNTLCTMSWLANTYHDQGQYIEAEVLYKKALAGQERQLGSEHPSTLWTMSELATAYRLQGQYIEAEVLCKQALEVQERKLGSKHPDTLRTLHKLALSYDKQGKNAEAEALYKRASAGRERPHMARSIRDLDSLETEGPCDEASEATTTRSNVPPDSPHVPAAELKSETPKLSDTLRRIRVAL
ncbi:MAG: hypothetical protein FRX48_06423 [Lasallia pustulata]|uniref:Uncharacterized protein n=1 Tax=Lasallia pustulata TaxID=136370 RepID=A0A5M8PKF3_9LECA|nr:MAG: hypothetical protein FRX48_06423 [Lasallia pustulata]